MEATERPVLFAIARAAVELTDAGGAAIVAVRGDKVTVVATAGPAPRRTVGERVATGDDTLSFVLASGQSLSLAPSVDDRRPDAGSEPRAEPPPASLCVPCVGADGVVGALELSGRPRSGPFDVAPARAAEVLAGIATAELVHGVGRPTAAPTPRELASELAQLAAIDEPRYRAIAWALESLLAR